MSNRTVQINNHTFITETEKAECVAVISRVVVKIQVYLAEKPGEYCKTKTMLFTCNGWEKRFHNRKIGMSSW